jgi:chromatin structure-remodeling complex subunit RSC4
MKLVPRKLYPDYYKVIARPMALDNVKSRLELNGYPSVESVMADLELIFENAKAYNVEGSGIYSDAADLHVSVFHTWQRDPVEHRPYDTGRPSYFKSTAR